MQINLYGYHSIPYRAERVKPEGHKTRDALLGTAFLKSQLKFILKKFLQNITSVKGVKPI